jgi:hypothetical protein
VELVEAGRFHRWMSGGGCRRANVTRIPRRSKDLAPAAPRRTISPR